MAYRFSGTGGNIEFNIAPFVGYTFGALTFAVLLKRNALVSTTVHRMIRFVDSTVASNRVLFEFELTTTPDGLGYVNNVGASKASTALTSTSVWYLVTVTRAAGAATPRFHWHDGTSWTHQNGNVSRNDSPIILAGDRLFFSDAAVVNLSADVACAGVKKADSTDLAVTALLPTSFQSWRDFAFDWLIGFDSSLTSGGLLQDQASPGTGDEIGKTGTSVVADPPGWAWTPTVTPVADFTGTPLSGVAPLSVTFTDASTNTPTSWAWDFGDTGTSTSQNPTHSYAAAGTYTVALTATNAAGNNTKTRTGYVTASSAFVPQIIWFTPAPASGVTAPTFESATLYSTVANRPAVTGTTRTFTSSATLATALNASSPGDLVQYSGTGVLDIGGNYVGLAGRRYSGYVTVDLGLPGSANHVRFTGGGGAGLPAVGIYNSAFLRIYGGEITNPPPKSAGHDGLHIYGAGHAHDGSTNHISWYNLAVHDTVDSGIKMLPNVPFGGSGQTAADLTIADCDIQAEVYRIGLDKTVDTHPEQGTGQHCCLLADVDPSGATYPSFLRNRVAIDGHDTGPPATQGGGSIIEIGFPDALSTISGCTLIIRGLNTLMNAQQQTAGNGLNLWGDAQVNAAVPFIQHTNATGSAVCNFPPGYNRSGVVVAYGRHTSTNRNAYEGTNPWQLGPTYRDVA